MRKKVLSVVLCIGLMFTFLPVAAGAETVADAGTQIYALSGMSTGDAYADKIIADYISENISDSMTLYEKLEAMCKFVCDFDYDASYFSASDMIRNGGGDCWASTHIILIMCDNLGINANARNGNKDAGAGSGHRNVFVTESEGSYYEVDAGYDGTAPRHYSIAKRNSPFSFFYVSGGIMIYQYDGVPSAITKLEIPSKIDDETVVAIGDSFLTLNETITEIVIPDTVTSIGKSAFNSCHALKTLNIPASVTSIGDLAFTACNALENFTCDADNSVFTIENGVLYNKEKTTLIFAPSCSSLVIPSTVTTIGRYSFYYNKKLILVIIPDSVTAVEEGAFGDCTVLESVTIPDSIITLGNSAFRNNASLKEVTFEGTSALTVDTDAFTGVPSDCKYYKTSDTKSITGAGAEKITMTSKDEDKDKNEDEDEAETYGITVLTAANGEIDTNVSSATKGATVTMTAKPKNGYALKSLTVKTASGSSVTISSSNTFIMPAEDVMITAEFQTETLEFSDVKSGDWYYDSVKYVHESKLMVGTSDTTFEPNVTTNRGMIVTILYRLEKEPSVVGLSNFPDVPSDAWYAQAVAWAKDKGITYGDEFGNFGAGNDLTREQMAAMFYRYAQMSGKAVESDAELTFTDTASVSSWAVDAFKWCVTNGIVRGKGNNILDPKGKATRAEMATIIQRFVEKVS